MFLKAIKKKWKSRWNLEDTRILQISRERRKQQEEQHGKQHPFFQEHWEVQ